MEAAVGVRRPLPAWPGPSYMPQFFVVDGSVKSSSRLGWPQLRAAPAVVGQFPDPDPDPVPEPEPEPEPEVVGVVPFPEVGVVPFPVPTPTPAPRPVEPPSGSVGPLLEGPERQLVGRNAGSATPAAASSPRSCTARGLGSPASSS